MAGKVTRMLLVLVTALTLAVGALGVSGGFGPYGTAFAAESNNGGNDVATGGDGDGTGTGDVLIDIGDYEAITGGLRDVVVE